MASVGLVGTNFLFMLSAMFSGGDILGLPPGERDSLYVQAAPVDAFYYSEWTARGEGKPGAPGIDGFAADPEVRLFVETVLETFRTVIASEFGGPSNPFTKSIPELYMAVLNGSGCAYLEFDAEKAAASVENPPEIPPGMPPAIMMAPNYRVTVILNPGEKNADSFGKNLESLLGLIPGLLQKPGLERQAFPIPIPGAELTLHRHENYFILGWGSGTIDRVVAALDDKTDGDTQSIQENPKFQAAMKKVGMDRVASLAWVDLGGLLKSHAESAGQQGMVYTQMAKILGLDKVGSYTQCVGVVDGRITQKGQLITGGQTARLLAVLGGRSLKADDFAHIPADADFYQVFSMDWPKVLAELRTVVGDADPVALDALNGTVKQLESELELSFDDDIFPAIGQVWSVHNSPSNGGLLFTSPVLTVDVKDADKAEKVFKRLMEVLQLAVPGQTREGRWGRGVYLTKHEFMGRDIHFINTVGDEIPFAPAFCLTETHIVATLNPQAIKAYLRGAEAKSPNLSAKVKKQLADHSGDVLSIGYANAEGAMQAFLSFAPYISQIVFSEIQRDGTPIDTFIWPSTRAFLPYIQDANSHAVRTDDGVVWHSEAALPIPGLSSVVGQMPVFLGFSYASMARQRARFAPVQDAIEVEAVEDDEF
ncbi:hypothetical protein [Thalassoroseus pseudoceratinae]|uniref:hypothetical protein n=1 Tax=Thalassoroseus pseudoceratinae TaxID=2713176 RepID=UPI00141E89A3|nr:hypothetical protein [Thalassoroseus pseudoceratinae]